MDPWLQDRQPNSINAIRATRNALAAYARLYSLSPGQDEPSPEVCRQHFAALYKINIEAARGERRPKPGARKEPRAAAAEDPLATRSTVATSERATDTLAALSAAGRGPVTEALNRIAMANKHLNAGQYSKAMGVFRSNGVLPCTPAVLKVLAGKKYINDPSVNLTEECERLVINESAAHRDPQFTQEDVCAALSAKSRTTGAGITGWSFADLKDALDYTRVPKRGEGTADQVARGLFLVIRDLARGRFHHKDTIGLCTDLRGVPLAKEEGSADPRPIGIGQLLTLLTTTVLLNSGAVQDNIPAAVGPSELAVGVRGGAEACPLFVECLLRAHRGKYVAVKTDISNAFNSVKRSVVMREGLQHFPELAHVIKMLYGTNTNIYYKDNEGNLQRITTNTEVTQGCPLGMLLFSVSIRAAVDATLLEHPDVVLAGYADDRYLVGTPENVGAALTTYSAELAKIGLRLQHAKSAVTFIGTGKAAADDAFRAHVAAIFSNVRGVDGETHRVPVEDGFLVTGTPVGSDAYIASQTQRIIGDYIERVKEQIAVFEKLREEPARAHTLYRMTRYCLAPALVTFHTRTIRSHDGFDGLLREFDDAALNLILIALKLMPDDCPSSAMYSPRVNTARGELTIQRIRLAAAQGGLGIHSAAECRVAARTGSLALSLTLVKGIVERHVDWNDDTLSAAIPDYNMLRHPPPAIGALYARAKAAFENRRNPQDTDTPAPLLAFHNEVYGPAASAAAAATQASAHGPPTATLQQPTSPHTQALGPGAPASLASPQLPQAAPPPPAPTPLSTFTWNLDCKSAHGTTAWRVTVTNDPAPISQWIDHVLPPSQPSGMNVPAEEDVIVLGFDVEHKPATRLAPHPPVSLVQLADKRSHSTLLAHIGGHASADGSALAPLRRLLLDSRVRLAGVGAREDAIKLWKRCTLTAEHAADTSSPLAQARDLSTAAQKGAHIPLGSRVNLGALAHNILGTADWKDTGAQTSDWTRYPLTIAQRTYAAMDAIWGAELARTMHATCQDPANMCDSVIPSAQAPAARRSRPPPLRAGHSGATDDTSIAARITARQYLGITSAINYEMRCWDGETALQCIAATSHAEGATALAGMLEQASFLSGAESGARYLLARANDACLSNTQFHAFTRLRLGLPATNDTPTEGRCPDCGQHLLDTWAPGHPLFCTGLTPGGQARRTATSAHICEALLRSMRSVATLAATAFGRPELMYTAIDVAQPKCADLWTERVAPSPGNTDQRADIGYKDVYGNFVYVGDVVLASLCPTTVLPTRAYAAPGGAAWKAHAGKQDLYHWRYNIPEPKPRANDRANIPRGRHLSTPPNTAWFAGLAFETGGCMHERTRDFIRAFTRYLADEGDPQGEHGRAGHDGAEVVWSPQQRAFYNSSLNRIYNSAAIALAKSVSITLLQYAERAQARPLNPLDTAPPHPNGDALRAATAIGITPLAADPTLERLCRAHSTMAQTLAAHGAAAPGQPQTQHLSPIATRLVALARRAATLPGTTPPQQEAALRTSALLSSIPAPVRDSIEASRNADTAAEARAHARQNSLGSPPVTTGMQHPHGPHPASRGGSPRGRGGGGGGGEGAEDEEEEGGRSTHLFQEEMDGAAPHLTRFTRPPPDRRSLCALCGGKPTTSKPLAPVTISPYPGMFHQHRGCTTRCKDFEPQSKDGSHRACALCGGEEGPFVTCNPPCPLIFHHDCFKHYPDISTPSTRVDLSALRPGDPPPPEWVCMECRIPPQPLHPQLALPSMRTMVAARAAFIQKVLAAEQEWAAVTSRDTTVGASHGAATEHGHAGCKRKHASSSLQAIPAPTTLHTVTRPLPPQK
jgi:hypothetical protein